MQDRPERHRDDGEDDARIVRQTKLAGEAAGGKGPMQRGEQDEHEDRRLRQPLSDMAEFEVTKLMRED